MNKVLLAVSAHPDDVEFGSGGTLFKFKDKGYDIYLVVATNGEFGFKIEHKPLKERIIIRRKEQLKAAKYLGIKKVFFLNRRDSYLKYSSRLINEIAGIIKKVKPEIVITFDPANTAFDNININHKDHRVIAEAVFDAVFAARNRYILPGIQHAVKKFYFIASDKPNHFENITKYITKKIALIKCHRSQYYYEKEFEEWIKSELSSYTSKYKYSEQFRVVNIVQPLKGKSH